MKRIFESLYPDRGGYTFFSVTVWEGVLEVFPGAGWNIPVRILEARYVIFGRIIHRCLKSVTTNNGNDWEKILRDADRLDMKWDKEFAIFEKSYQEFWEKNPNASGCRWNQFLKRVYE